MRIAIAQIASTPGDVDGTVERVLGAARRAAERAADLVVLPVTVFEGAYPLGVGASVSYTLAVLAAIEDLAARTPLPLAVPAYVDDGVRPYTEVFLCAESRVCPLRQRMAHGTGGEQAAADVDARWAADGVEVQFVLGDTGLMAHDATCDVLVMLPAIPFSDQDATGLGVAGLADSSYAGMVDESPCWVAVAQGVGAYDDAVFAGGSFASDPAGLLAAASPVFEEDLAVFDACPVAEFGAGAPRPDADAVALPPQPGVHVFAVAELTGAQRTGMLWRALVQAVRDYVRKSGFSDVVLGLSGGIDSAVVAALAADALGPEHVLCVLMPGPYSSAGSVDDALDLAGRLGMPTRTVPITGLFEACAPLFSDVLGDSFAGLARENLQARLRGTVLMTVSNATGALVLATGNKSEAGMGYSTLYGDTVGAYAPLCDLYKGRVYELARWRNEQAGGPVIPQAIIEKAPSAELSEGQTDEGSFGATYAQIDRILALHVEHGLGAADIVAAGEDPATVAHVLDACRKAEYKRRQEPFGPVVSLMPFVDRGWPVVFAWKDVPGEAPAPERSIEPDGPGFWGRAAEIPGEDDFDLLSEDPALRVPAVLEAMLMRSARQDELVGMVADVAFGALVSGRGPQMDNVMGIPMFSKN